MSAMKIKTYDKADKYLYIIFDDIPKILMPSVAYRRSGQQLLRDVKIINCPYCSNPLTEVGKNTKVELYRYPGRKKMRCQAYPICPTCKNTVGMILA